MGHANVRPFDVRARRWSEPADIWTNLDKMQVSCYYENQGEESACLPFSPLEFVIWGQLGKIDLIHLTPYPAGRPPGCAGRCLVSDFDGLLVFTRS